MIFFDNASTTKVRSECLRDIEHYYFTDYFNPSTLYSPGARVAMAIKQHKENMLSALNGKGKIVFTSGGTESDNLALLGLRYPKKSNFIFSPVEHSAVFNTANFLKQQGYGIRFCRCDSSGKADIESIKELIDEHTALVSVMHVCNETGAINDIGSIASEVKRINKHTLVHSDGVQALGKVGINLNSLKVDLYSISAHKINAPKGTGALFIKDGINLFNIMFGGAQEYGLRPSTENVAGIAAFGTALHLALAEQEEYVAKCQSINAIIRQGVLEIDNQICFISSNDCTPCILAFASNKVRGEVLLHALSKYDILVGTGSACSSSKHTYRIPSALGLSSYYQDGILRLSFGKDNTICETKEFLQVFAKVYADLARYS